MQSSRRRFLAGAGSFAVSCRVFGSVSDKGGVLSATLPDADQEKKRTRLILLGTKGGPSVGKSGRSNPSTVILINDVPYVVDCGYGVSRQLISAGVALNRVRYGGKDDTRVIAFYGPTGLQKLTQDFFEYQKFDIETRLVDEGGTDPRKLIFVHEFESAGVVLQNEDVRITSCRVRHPPITQSYAYRFDTPDRSVVISGDTAYAPELAEFTKGADVLVHEVMYLPGIERLIKQSSGAKRLREHLLAAHTSTEDVGKIAAQAGVKTLVLTHFVPGDDPSITDEQWAEGVRRHFKGRIIVGKDLMEI